MDFGNIECILSLAFILSGRFVSHRNMRCSLGSDMGRWECFEAV